MGHKTHNKLKRIKKEQGQAMLLVIVTLTAASLIVATSVLFSGLGELDMGYTYQCGEEGFALGDGCLEETLRRIDIDSGYAGGSLALSNGSCIIGVSGSATNKTIYATSTVGNCNKRFQANIVIGSGSTSVSNWLEY
jgi:hypothetical protein